MKKVLIVAAHPDDEILGCGGTVLKRKLAGNEVYSLVLGEGVTSRYNKREDAPQEEVQSLHDIHAKVSSFMGFTNSWLYDFPDNRFDSVDLLDIIKVIEKIKNEVNPDIIYTHFEGDLNIDHRITFQAVLTACRPLPGDSVRKILSFEIPSSTEWSSPSNYFRPNVFVNIEDTINTKVKAMSIYEQEVKQYPHPRSLEALSIISQRWGLVCGYRYAEAFMLVRSIHL